MQVEQHVELVELVWEVLQVLRDVSYHTYSIEHGIDVGEAQLNK